MYEGRKVLYRFALAILKLYEKKILQMSDTNYILSYLKRLPKHIFNVDDLFDVSKLLVLYCCVCILFMAMNNQVDF